MQSSCCQTCPGLRVRQVDTGVEILSGRTLVIGGLIQDRVIGKESGPSDSSPPGKQPKETTEQVELLVLVKPQILEPSPVDRLEASRPARSAHGPVPPRAPPQLRR